jgi:hypothetical protein
VRCGRARFWAAEERGADRGRRGASRENSRQSRAGGDPASGNQRKVDPGTDKAEQSEEPVVLVTIGVDEGTAVPACLDPLDDERVSPRRGRLDSFLDRPRGRTR